MAPTELQRAALDDLIDSLNPAQREAVEHLEGPLLIFAGAGSGKTRVLTTRIANLIASKKVWPDRLLAVTFTNRAAKEMRERVGRLVESGEGMWVGTFHHTAVRMLRRDAGKIGLPSNFTIFDEDDSRAALKRVLDELRLDSKKYPPSLISALISQAKNELVTPDNYPNRSYSDEIVRRCYERYEELLRRSGGLDFDDLIVKVVRLLQADEEARERWQDRFRHVLVDEYQDTNRAQYVLVNLLAAAHRNIAVVGDDDQAVYGWRGADVRNILDFKKDYPEATVIHLEQNYRSTQAILDAAHHVIRHNEERAPKKLWTDRIGGERVHAAQLYNEVEEAEYVADEIERLRRTEERGYGDFAVLYRVNAQSRAMEDVFGRRRIPYRLVGGVRFWERREVKDLLAYLRLVQNPADAVSFGRVVNVPRRKIGPVSVDAVVAHARDTDRSLLDVLSQPETIPNLPRAAVAPLASFRAQLESVRSTLGVLRPTELIDHLIEVVGLTAVYEDGTPQGDARIENLREVRGLAEEFDTHDDPAEALELFLTEITLRSDVDSYTEDEEGVTLITLHMVKGLEFPVVFLAGLEEGLLPHRRALEDEKQMPEERRLCYVGITRAQDRLYLTCAFRRHLYGQAQPGFPSRFLQEIPQALLAPPRRGAAPVAPPRQGYRERMVERQVEAVPAPPPVQRFKEGDLIAHPSFGPGVVMKSTLTRTDEELVVRFDRAGVKILSANLAPLERR
ncbi:MAG: ATP-dependent DNA helicase PcrA [Candidatus Nephthysia bennettiae]|uniref:DNA 3'-5' helicase n=1 Tax=Candidatus Nephthysia bennettiae TaxID=3127016 RepID=A0A934K9P5_9BACT|nr:UvrD-helicase domain-containing protein [Candidatus Dormibacteraeota bacterium]MBJ7614449.1 UvrD-helicase domain-containing protein [Candidatus Dormibacteraeota bacterium]PZR87231.1 MAG: ATP-dependent DNA helicase PcrA [Candidatus Dormibacteraeota bacterium]